MGSLCLRRTETGKTPGGSGALAGGVDGLVGKRIGPLVARVAAMPLDPVPLDGVAMGLLEQFPPQLGILYRLLAGGLPAALDPVMDPLGDAATQVLRIGPELDATRPLEFPQRHDRRH